MSEWRDTETAPRDGTIFVGLVQGQPQFLAWVNDVLHKERELVPVAGTFSLLKVWRENVVKESGFRVLMPPGRGHGFGLHGNYAPVHPERWMPLPAWGEEQT